ncbi:MAG: asparagine synthase [bacterium]|nr:asparagine synthase [bacterium]
MNVEKAIEEYSQLLNDSIRLRIRADVPLGSMLSGGIDSSVLTAYVGKYLGQGKPSCFTYDYDIAQGEAVRAKQVTDALQIPWTLVTLSHKEIPSKLRELVRFHEEPITSLVIPAHHKVYEAAREKGLTILLEGHGGDELGAGYEYYYMPYVMDILRKAEPIDAGAVINRFMDKFNIAGEKRFGRLLDTLQTTLRPGISTHDGLSFVDTRCLAPAFLDEHREKEPELKKLTESYLTNLQYCDFRHVVLPRALRYADRASMASSLEARVPILDHRIVEMSFSTVVDARINEYQQRYFMIRAAEKSLPEKILKRPKVTIVDPQRPWLQKDLKPWMMELFNWKGVEELGIFDKETVIKEYERFCNTPSPRTSFHIFQYANVILWYQEMFKV